MARQQRIQRELKEVYYFIVEGYTEENYLNLLKKLYKKSGDIKNCKGGNAKGVMEKAQKLINSKEGLYDGFVIWFDGDRYDPKNPEELKLYSRLLKKEKVEIYISEPCIEAWLLAHFETVQHCKNKECSKCEEKLKTHIPNYEKNNCTLLENYIKKYNICDAIINYPAIKDYQKIGFFLQNYFNI
jgi:hypothetical protein